MAAATPVEVFCSYAHEDEFWLRKLEAHLSLLKRQGLISVWYKRKIAPGTDWAREIDSHLDTASLILLLISPDFLASDYCYGVEMQRALKRHAANATRVIPILLRHCDWQSAPFAHLQTLPTNAKPIIRWRDRDEAMTEAATGIRLALENYPLLTASLPHSGLPTLWNVPFARNPFFSGREEQLARFHEQLCQSNIAAIGQMQAISGLGGIGKTQIAIEYAYRFHQDYQAVLWVRAENVEALNSSYTEIATLLNLPEKDQQKQEAIVQTIKTWLRTHSEWLLILDNADEPDLITSFLPPVIGGHILITTRATDLGGLGLSIAHPIEINAFSLDEGVYFLLRRIGRLEQVTPQDHEVARQISQELGGLPLALDQAGAYIAAAGVNLADYLHLYQMRRSELLKQRRNHDHPQSVATTWNISFEHVGAANPAAAELLSFCAFLAPDPIPEEIFVTGANEFGPVLASVVADPFLLNEAIEALRAYSLVTRDPQERALSVHRLIQVVLRDTFSVEIQRQRIQQAIHVINAALPEVEFENWSTCGRLLPHALFCAAQIEQPQMLTPQAARLLNQTGYYLTERGRYVEAEVLFHFALMICELGWGFGHPTTATVLNNLGGLYVEQGKYADAELLMQHALTINEEQLGTKHPETATTLNNLATLRENQGNYADAESLVQSALTIREQHLGPKHPQTATSLNNLANLYVRQGNYAKAEVLYQRVLVIYEHLGADHPLRAVIFNNLAELYRQEERYVEAEPLYRRALTIYEQQIGTEHPDTAEILNNLALLHESQGKYGEAEESFQHALAIQEQCLESGHPSMMNTMNNLASFYKNVKRYVEAELLYKRVLTLREQQLGAEHPDIIVSLKQLAELYKDQQKYVEAESLLWRVWTIQERQLGPDHPDIATNLNNLAFLCEDQGKYLEAEVWYRRALKIDEDQLGAEHQQTAIVLNNLASLNKKQNKYVEAESLLERALAINEKIYGLEHPIVATNLHHLAEVYVGQKRYVKAKPLFQRALSICEQALGPEHPDTQLARNNYVTLLLEMDKYTKKVPHKLKYKKRRN